MLRFQAFLARGHVIVAAVGNDGPAAPVKYPAAYSGVVGVTSVDAARNIQLDAGQGEDVMFAARGVGVRVAGAKGHYESATGTSFASPLVAARFALMMKRADAQLSAQATKTLERDAHRSRRAGPRSCFRLWISRCAGRDGAHREGAMNLEWRPREDSNFRPTV